MLRYHGPLQVLRSTQNHFWTPRWKFKKEPLLVVYTDSGKDVARGHWSTWAFHLLAAFQRHTEAYMPFLEQSWKTMHGVLWPLEGRHSLCLHRSLVTLLKVSTLLQLHRAEQNISSVFHICPQRKHWLFRRCFHSRNENSLVRILSDLSLEDSLKLCFVIQGPVYQDRKVHFSGNYIFSHFSIEQFDCHIFIYIHDIPLQVPVDPSIQNW